jgi:hypothetical protein
MDYARSVLRRAPSEVTQSWVGECVGCEGCHDDGGVMMTCVRLKDNSNRGALISQIESGTW